MRGTSLWSGLLCSLCRNCHPTLFTPVKNIIQLFRCQMILGGLFVHHINMVLFGLIINVLSALMRHQPHRYQPCQMLQYLSITTAGGLPAHLFYQHVYTA